MIELSKKFVCILTTAGENPEVAKMMNVSGLPDVRILTSKGEVVEHFTGGVSAEKLAAAMEAALAKK